MRLGRVGRGLASRGSVLQGSVEVNAQRLAELEYAEAELFARKKIARPEEIRALVINSTRNELDQFIGNHLPQILAHQVAGLAAIPGWTLSEDLVHVHQNYLRSFLELREMRYRPSDPDVFQTAVRRIKLRHEHTARVVKGMKMRMKAENLDVHWCNSFLDRFFTNRIGAHMLLSQSLLQDKIPNDKMFAANSAVSSIDMRVLAEHAIQNTERTFRSSYGLHVPAVDLTVTGCWNQFRFVPRFFCYIFEELLKNALRATFEAHEGTEMPPVNVMLTLEGNVACVHVSDRGQGIPMDKQQMIWSYLYSSAAEITTNVDEPFTQTVGIENLTEELREAVRSSGDDMACRESTLAGTGCGLPLSRLYAEYFGGVLLLKSMPNHGTDTFLYLPTMEGCLRNPNDETTSIMSALDQLRVRSHEGPLRWSRENLIVNSNRESRAQAFS
jgi:pyruvate dehydrogenase kinase 2/3/4